jgi:perosamine synthetase
MTTPKFLPYGHQTVDDQDVQAVVEVLRSDWLTQGPVVERFEDALRARCGARHAVAVSSGTAALHLAALAAGIRPGERVATTPLTFLATANCIRYAGGEPAFADVDPDTLNLDPHRLEELLAAGTGRGALRGVIPVHFAGCPADMERIAATARRHGLFVIEDASHALGASYQDRSGRRIPVGSCAHSEMTTLSFHPVKHVTTGEGGAVLTNDDDLARTLRRLRTHGIERDPSRLSRLDGPWYYEMRELGFNYRITDFQCALGVAQLARLDGWIARRAEIVARYREAFRGDPRIRFVVEPEWAHPAWHLFAVQVPQREAVYRRLRERGIGVQVHYLPVHLHPYYRELLGTREGDFPEAEGYYDRALSLPLYPALLDQEADRVIEEVLGALRSLA